MHQLPRDRTDLPPTLATLFLSFLRLGVTAFGGPAMVAYIRRMAVQQKCWLDDEVFRTGVALCQTIPGATAMQTAAYVGFRTRGVRGAAASFVGFGLPAFCLMVILSELYVRAHGLPVITAAFDGLQTIIIGIVANATITFGKTYLKGWRDVFLAGMAAGLFVLGVNPIWVLCLSAGMGLVLYNRQSLTTKTSGLAIPAPSTRALVAILTGAAVGVGLLFFTDQGLFELATLMFRIDLFAFGGGFASVPIMVHEVVDLRAWMDNSTFMNGIALGQVTPGPIVITAAFVGYWLHGLAGAVVATVSVFLPSFLLVIGLTPYYDRLRGSVHLNRALAGILASFVGLLLSVTIRFALNIQWDLQHVLLAISTLGALLLHVDLLWIVLIGIAVSIVLFRTAS